MFFSIIIPLYNRPQEIDELLESLTQQKYTAFEVLIIEDGSVLDAREIVARYEARLDIRYYYKPNSGQGFARNYGFERAKGDYFVIFDSDCLIPPDYLTHVVAFLAHTPLDAYGGPDAAHPSFTSVQKAISYAMTSPLTTGGIRGNKRHVGTFHPRSFNMGISRAVWEKTGGFVLTRLGEDIEFSIRINESGFRIGLIPNAVVYHKRRTNFMQFYKQLHFFGRARINIYKHFPSELKLVHFFPSMFVVFLLVMLLAFILGVVLPSERWGGSLFQVGQFGLYTILVYGCLLFLHARWRTRDFGVSVLAVAASVIQLVAYGLGFMQDFWRRLILKRS